MRLLCGSREAAGGWAPAGRGTRVPPAAGRRGAPGTGRGPCAVGEALQRTPSGLQL